MLNITNPTTVFIHIRSSVADFQLPGQLGWQANINLTHLSQYPLGEDEYYERIVDLLEDIAIVPLDNMAIAEPACAAVKQAHLAAIEAFKEQRLKGDANVSFTHTVEKDGWYIYKLDIMANVRELHPDTTAFLETF